MQRTIYQLIPDIYALIQRKDGWFNDELAQSLSIDIGKRLQRSLGEPERAPTLRLSQMGPRCPKALWHSIHTPELAEPLPPWAQIKFSYGHILEALAVALAKAAGHSVVGEQDAIVLDGITGHRDAVVDGAIVDFKSCSSRAFLKFKEKSIAMDDSFGYLDQLDGYVVGSNQDPLVLMKDRGFIVAIDKTLGHMCLYEHFIREQSIKSRIEKSKKIVELSNPPACECGTKSHGASGNLKLDIKASYSAYKFCCFSRLRTFLYAEGPVYLAHVARKPDVTEVDRDGKIVYN